MPRVSFSQMDRARRVRKPRRPTIDASTIAVIIWAITLLGVALAA